MNGQVRVTLALAPRRTAPRRQSSFRSAPARRTTPAEAIRARIVRLLLLAAIFTVFSIRPAQGQGWYDGSWQYRKAITIDFTKVGATGAPHANFPVLVSVTDADLAADAQADGDDILFTSSDGATKLDHEIERYTSGSGVLIAWVRAPSLSAASNTVLYLYYGNPSVGSQQNAAGVWDANYRGVWHLKEDPSGTAPQMQESTSNANHGASAGSMTAGDQVAAQIGGGLDFDGADDVIDAGSPASLDDLTPFTFSAWVYPRTMGGQSDGRILHKGSTSARKQLQISSGGTNDFALLVNRATTLADAEGADNTATLNQWQYVCGTYDPTDGPRVYRNGVEIGYRSLAVGSGSTTSDAAFNFYIGNRPTQDKGWDGILDEARASNIVRSTGWMVTEYNNGDSPSTFYALGPEVVARTIGGRVFEDANFAGAAAAWDGGTADLGLDNVDVELYGAGDVYLSSVATSTGGLFSFSVADGSYKVRVRSATIGDADTAPKGTLNGTVPGTWPYPLAEMTWGNGAALYGGQSATVDDAATGDNAGPGDTYVAVTVSGANVTGVDCGFAFNLIVNVNDDSNAGNVRSVQGGLRQFIKNANAIGAAGGTTANSSQFRMQVAANQSSGGDSWWRITPPTALPSVADAGATLDGSTQRTNSGANSNSLGPEIELYGASAGGTANGLRLTAGTSTVRELAIGSFDVDGIDISGGSAHLIVGNYLGAGATGAVDRGNWNDGIDIAGASGNVIGGTDATDRNVIAYNDNEGINFSGATTTGNTVIGNYIGVAADGATAAGNGDVGIALLVGSNGNTIGGTDPAERNVISMNYEGVEIGSSNNTVTGNYIGTDKNGTANLGQTSSDAVEVIGSATNNTIEGNLVAFTKAGFHGVSIEGGSGNPVLRNAIHSNTGLGINLGASGVDTNDGAKTGGQPNLLMDYPVFTSATLGGTTLTVAGYVGSAPSQAAFANSSVEVCESDNDGTGFGEGKTYLGVLSTSGSNGNFSGTIDVSGKGLLVGENITGTATDPSNNTSEFGANFTVTAATYALSGRVFEDVNYGGGAGRNWATASGNGGSLRSAARVELFDGAEAFVTSTTTDGSGNYTFASLAAGNYTIRVVSSSVTSSRTGYIAALIPVMAYRTNASTGTAVDVTDYVGGHDPATVDAGDAAAGWILDSGTGVFSGGGSGKAHAFAPVTITAASVTGVDFGWNFDTIANTSNAGQSSLRQFITNANTLGGDASLAQSGLVAAKENAVFMISNGTAAAGLRAANNYFSGGGATISPTSALPDITTPMILDAQKQPGWTSAPVIEIAGNLAGAGVSGLQLDSGSEGSVVQGLIVNRFDNNGITGTADSILIAGNYVGTDISGALDQGNVDDGIEPAGDNWTIGVATATGRNVVSGNNDNGILLNSDGHTVVANFVGTNASGTALLGNGDEGIEMTPSSQDNVVGGAGTLDGNVVSGNGGDGMLVNDSPNNQILGNIIGLDVGGTIDLGNTGAGVRIQGGASGNTVGGTDPGSRNVISKNGGSGIRIANGASNVIQGNFIGTDFTGTIALGNDAHGVHVSAAGSDNNTIGGTASEAGNLVANNAGMGVLIQTDGATGNAILRNSIFASGSIGIDLRDDVVTANNGTKDASRPNFDMDHPVFSSAVLGGNMLVVAGYVGSAPGQPTFASARVEIFESDNDGSTFGEGKTYLDFLTTDANGNFSGTLDVIGKGLTAGEKITGTATDGTNNTSEFGANFTVTAATYALSGRVFEDVNYGGGAGRNWATVSGSGGSARSAARLELFDNAGAYVTFATTDGSGIYSFSGLAPANYTVRAVSASVTSSRTGYVTSLLPVQTVRTDASTGAAVDVTNYVGGHDPATADAGDAAAGWILNPTTGVLSGSGSGQAHAFAPVTVSAADITGVDFGWNFDTIANTNDGGQGSLRQCLANADTLGGDASLAQSGLVAAKENAVFMISNGTNDPGLRAANNYFAGGAATISLGSPLPVIANPVVLDAQKQPGWVSAPILELDGTSAGPGCNGLAITAGGSTVRGMVINRFSASAIDLSVGGSNSVQGNYLGVDVTGSIDLGNGASGVWITSAGNTIGGDTPDERNVIAGNGDADVRIEGGSATGNAVIGNYLGTDAAGVAAMDGPYGVYVDGPGNDVGGAAVAEGNLISGHTTVNDGGVGVYLASTGNRVRGNRIGTDHTGLLSLPNNYGVGAFDANNTIGGDTVGERNVISANTIAGIYITGNSATGNVITGNYVGADANGTGALGNTLVGVLVDNAPGNTIGGVGAGEENIVSANGQVGIYIGNPLSTGNVILGNRVGADVSGTLGLGNGGYGILLADGANGNVVGGSANGAGSVIVDHPIAGIALNGSGGSVDGNVIQGNFIGTDEAAVVSLGNGAGVGWELASNNQIGGVDPGEANVIAHSDSLGVGGGQGTGNSIVSNRIYANGYLGIDLGVDGLTPNDPGDVDSGANDLLNAPVLTATAAGGGTLTVDFDLDVPAGSYRVEFFGNPSGVDPSGYGEGEVLAGAVSVTHPGGGVVNFSHTFSGSAGEALTATATQCTDGALCAAFGNSSEFSASINVEPLAIVKRAFLLDGTPVADSSVLPRGTPFRFLIYVNNPGGAVSDVSVRDVLDAAFVYQTGTLRYDASTAACPAGGCSAGQEAAIYAAATAGSVGTDGVDGDILSFSSGTVDAGDQSVGNIQLDLPADKVWSLVFTSKIQ